MIKPNMLMLFIVVCFTTSFATRTAAEDRHLLVVTNQGDGTLSVIDPDSLEVVGEMELGNGPHEVTSDPHTGIIYISMYGRQISNNHIAVVDPFELRLDERWTLEPYERPHGIEWRDQSLFVTAERHGRVLQLSSEGKIVWEAETGGELGHMLAVSTDGQTVYTGNMKTNDVSIIPVDAPDQVVRIPVGKGPEGIALSPDDRELWVAHRMGGGISVIDTVLRRVVATPGDGIFSARLSFSPDGQKVLAYDMPTRSVILFDRTTRQELGRYQPTEGTPVSGIVAGDSSRAFIVRYQPDAIVELDLERMKEGRTVETGSMPDGLAIVRR